LKERKGERGSNDDVAGKGKRDEEAIGEEGRKIKTRERIKFW
jgi:hypothetical protein